MSNLILREAEVTYVTGSWTVPSVSATENDTYSSVWVGVGGYGEKTLIQTGTAQQSVKGVIEYYAWYELLPNLAVRLPKFKISPGDTMTAAITLVDSDSNMWNLEIRDLTTGDSFSDDFAYNSSRLSSEWVVEAPSLEGQTQTLANFGEVTFTSCSATIANTTGPVSNFPSYRLIMYDSQDVQLVTVSGFDSKGSSFNVTYSKNVSKQIPRT